MASYPMLKTEVSVQINLVFRLPTCKNIGTNMRHNYYTKKMYRYEF